MSTAPAHAPVKAPLISARTHFLIRRLHSLTGILFGGYICVHLLVNATLIEKIRYVAPGAVTVYQQQVNKIHELPFLTAIQWALIYLPILFHTFYGLFITVTGQPNVTNYPYGKNWFYFFQRVSAMVLVLFIGFHVFAMHGFLGDALKFNHVEATSSVTRHMQAHWAVAYLVYPVGILAATFHLANGFWTAAITWGLTVSKSAQKRWGLACIGLFAFTSACGFAAWVALISGTP